MIVLITGGREYRNRRELDRVLDHLHAKHRFSYLVHGGAPGADTLAHKWAHSRGVQPVAMEALWDFEGNPAGGRRNKRMYVFTKPRMIIAFSGGTGTANMMKVGYDAKRKGDLVDIIDVEDLVF